MRNFSRSNAIRFFKLPFKFMYLIVCNIFFVIFFIYIHFCPKKKFKKFTNEKKVICLSHVAISFDGRIKKTANQLVKLGFDVSLLKPVDVEEDKDLERSGLDEKVTVKSIGLSGVFSYFPCVFDLCMFFYILFSNARFLHCHDVNTAFMGIIASKLLGKILVVDLHEWKSETTDPNQKEQALMGLQKKIYQAVERQVLNNADFVITVNDVIADKMKQFYEITREIFIVRNIPEFSELSAYNMRDKLGISKSAFVVYYVGQIAHYRNIDQILVAISQCKDVVFVIQGTISIAYLNQLQNLCDSLRIANRVFSLPPVPHEMIPSVCQGADVGIFTCHAIAKSMYYSLPNKLFEYIFGEVPIISENFPVMRSYIEKYNIGTLIDSKDPKTIVNAINSYLKNGKAELQKQNILSLKRELSCNNEISLVYNSIYLG